MNGQVKIALCYITHDHVDIIRDILEKSLSSYDLYGIDVYVYDDSLEPSTKVAVNEYIQNGYRNVTYLDMRSVGAEKILLCMKGHGQKEKYDYILPVKDRVCFSESYLKRLVDVLKKDPDVVIGMDLHRRWNADRAYDSLCYNDASLFYRDLGFYATNWEMLCFRVDTMLQQTSEDLFMKSYNPQNPSPFFTFSLLFERLAEMSNPRIFYCPYENDDLYICHGATSGWWNELFSLWIDKWVAANYALPSIYDPYKMEVIKSLTNLTDKFGSVEQMMNYHAQGIYTMDVFKKYESMWPFITEIPVGWLRLIAEDDYDTVIRLAIADFEQSLRNRNYNRAHWLLFSNQWFSQVYSEEKYYALLAGLYVFYDQMIKTGHSDAFDGLETMDDIVAKYQNS